MILCSFLFITHSFWHVLSTVKKDSHYAENREPLSLLPVATIRRNENNVHGMVGQPSVKLLGVFENVRTPKPTFIVISDVYKIYSS